MRRHCSFPVVHDERRKQRAFRPSVGVLLSSTAALVLLVANTASSFLLPVKCRKMNNPSTSHEQQHIGVPKRGGEGSRLMVSRTQDLSTDDPWVLLDEFKRWAILNRGKYDLTDFQRAINNLRTECQINIETLEKEIASVQSTLESSEQYNQQQQWESANKSCYNSVEDYSIPTSSVKAIFAGYQFTDDDRERMMSAHPEDYC